MQNVIEGYQLSPQQKNLWLSPQEDEVYRAQCGILIEGRLDRDVLKEALQRIVARHEILRTTFYRRSGIRLPIQVVAERDTALWRYVVLNSWNEHEQAVDIEEIRQEERRLPFDFQRGPLLHACLVNLSPQAHLLLLTLPSLCADERTLKQLFKELSDFYRLALRDEEETDEATQYAQYAEWRNELLETEDAATGKEYWLKQEADTLPLLKLPLEKQPDETTAFRLSSLTTDVEPETVEKLETVALWNNTSADVLLLACWQTLLWRLTGQTDLAVGRVFEGRKYEELEEAFGLFAESLPVRASLHGETPFAAVLRKAVETTRDAYAWQEYFTWMKETGAAPSNGAAQSDLLPAFVYDERPAPCQAAGLTFSYLQQYCCYDRFKIKLSCVRQAGSLKVELQFDASYFEAGPVERIARCFKTLLKSACAHPELSIGELELLSDADRRQLLVDFNRTGADFPRDKRIHQLFEEQAELTPFATAVVCGERQLTYRELNAGANRIAHLLRQRGVERDVTVGLCVERSLEMIVGLLGVLKAGGAYVALDPEQPAERLAYQLEDTRAPVLLTQEKLLSRVPDFAGEILCFDRDSALLERGAETNPRDEQAGPEHLAYVIYTSGSTGVPKGVAVAHRSLVNYASFICRKLELDAPSAQEGLHFATVSTISADLGNTVIFPSLITGGCLHVLGYEIATDGNKFADYLSRRPIDVLKIVPSHLNALLSAEGQTAAPLPRRHLILGGEALSWELAQRLSEMGGGCQVLNHYGPTETTVGSLTFSLEEHQDYRWPTATVPVGRPVANTQVYVLDERQQPVPPGVAGEIYIGGEGVARGYLNQAAQTAERFVPHRFSTEREARLYKTGDLGRYLPDGNIEFLGRVDHQVKIRGYRIELGEIEAVLRAHQSVRAAVVMAREDEPGRQSLVAYVVPELTPAPGAGELRDHLRQKLPEYMLPSSFVMLRSLPLTPNGKINRAALPKPEQAKAVTEDAPRESLNAVEKILTDIWQRVLRVEQIGIHDNFFERGGDSILSIQIITKANQAGLRLTPKQLFDHPTIAELAAVAETDALVEFEQGMITGEMPLLPIQHWFFEQNLPEPQHWNMAVLLETREATDSDLLEKAARRLFLHHDALRLRFVEGQTGWRQFNAGDEGAVSFSRFDLSDLPQQAQRERIEATAGELQASLNLSEGALVRFAHFDLGAGRRGRLLVVIHHLLVDGVSWRILLGDLQTAYEQLSRRQEISLPAKTTSFKQWASRIEEHARSEGLRAELSYWLDESRARAAALPVDFAGGENTEASTRSVTVSLGVEETRALLQEVPEVYHTQINDVLLTALLQTFARWTGSNSLLVDMEGHGREEIVNDTDLSRTVGWFTTHFPVLLNLRDASDQKESLKSVKEQLRRIPNRGIGYGLLRYLSRDEETRGRLRALPEPEVSFNYLGQFDQVLDESSLFGAAQESSGAAKSRLGRRSHLLRINGSIMGGRLQLAWAYSENIHRRQTVETLAENFINALRAVISHCLTPEAGGFTSSDFPQADVRQEDLDKLMAKFTQGSRR